MADEPGQENSDAPSSEDKLSRSRLIKVAIAGAILLVVILWVWVNPSDPTEKKDFIQAVGVLLAALAGLGGLYFTSQNLKQTRQDTEKQLQQARDSTKGQLQQARESQVQNQRLAEQGQITERFTRAIDQLGKIEDGKKLFEIRVGGIYALERIARESEEDYWPIMEILTAYVRQNAPLPSEVGQEHTQDATNEQRAMEGSGGKSETTKPSAPDPDIQAIMTILRRRKGHFGHGEPERLHLSETNLYEANLTGANLTGANLSRANLPEADLSGANLPEADLSGANLYKADLPEANLTGANLYGAYGANLIEANLTGARLIDANLPEADLTRANLTGANLTGARLIDANLYEANLIGANLTGADLTGADLSRANLPEADLTRANLYKADLTGADLSGANPLITGASSLLSGANLYEADLTGANLSGANLTQKQLEDTAGNEDTKLPLDLQRPAHWWSWKTDE